jgi:ribosomal protein S27E
MDAIEFIDLHCPACGRLARYPAIHAGSQVSCPSCKHTHLLPLREVALAVAAPALPALPVAPAIVVPPAVPAAAPTAPAAAAPAAAAAADKVLFVCTACTYRARIPAQYVGMAVRCPSCDAAQIATPEDGGASTGRTVQISRMASSATTKGKSSKTTVRPGNILFTCGQCSFEAQLAKHYLGKAIRCPGCHAPQVVVDSSGTAEAPPAADSAPATDPRFICISCGYRARIPDQYMGLAVTCPKCETVQIASREDNEAPSTGDTVSISRIKTSEPVKSAKRAPGEDQVPFSCTACGFKSQLGKSLLGMAIKCPGCQATQVVGGVGGPGASASSSASASASASASSTSGSGSGAASSPGDGREPATVTAAAMSATGDKVRFTCSACGFKARIPATYAGETIHCPGCNVVQLVLRSGPASAAATGNTQVLNTVQTASAPPLEAPSTTPEYGSPIIADPAKPATVAVAAPARSAPAAAPVTAAIPIAHAAPAALPAQAPAPIALPALPSPAPAWPVAAKPAPAPAPAKPATGANDLKLESHTPPVPAATVSPPRTGKVVRRNAQTPTPPSVPPEDGEGNAADAPAAAARAPAPPPKPTPARPPVAAKPPAAPAPPASPARGPAMDDRAPRTSPVLIILMLSILLAVVGGGGLLGYQLMKIQQKLTEAENELKSTNLKLSKAEQEAKESRADAEASKKAQEAEVTARKAADEKAAALAKQLEEAAAKAEAARAEAEKAKAEAEKAQQAAKPDPATPPPAK